MADDESPTGDDAEETGGETGVDHESVVIEPPSSDDVAAITEQWVALAEEQLAYGSRVRPEANRGTIREILAAHRAADGLLVARDSETIVGFATFTVEHGALEVDATRGLLSNLYVVPTCRGRGVGTELLEAVEEVLADRGVRVLSLEVLATNERARRFYRRNRYEPQRFVMERSLEGR